MAEITDRQDQRDHEDHRRAPGPLQAILRGAVQSLAIVATMVGMGLAVGALAGPPEPEPTSYHPGRMSSGSSASQRWLIDGFNVLHTGVLRGRERGTWWESDARGQLLQRVRGFSEVGAELWIVFDGPRPAEDPSEEAGGLRVVFAPSADDWLLKEVHRAEAPQSLTVVTADRKLADRARHRGARVVSPRSFLARCSPA